MYTIFMQDRFRRESQSARGCLCLIFPKIRLQKKEKAIFGVGFQDKERGVEPTAVLHFAHYSPASLTVKQYCRAVCIDHSCIPRRGTAPSVISRVDRSCTYKHSTYQPTGTVPVRGFATQVQGSLKNEHYVCVLARYHAFSPSRCNRSRRREERR